MTDKKKFNLREHITSKIITAIENGANGDQWQMPWHRGNNGSSMLMPQNATSGRYYSGVNVLLLWIASDEFGFTSNKWATSRQWKKAGRTIREDVFTDLETGEKRGKDEMERAQIVYFGHFNPKDPDTGERDLDVRIPMLKYSIVYNECQLEDYEPLKTDNKPEFKDGKIVTLSHIDDIFKKLQVKIKHSGNRAYYSLDGDKINMPLKKYFTGSDTLTPTESYYSTKLHELMHWTGIEDRMNRDMSGFFGDPSYAYEELVAEIGSAITCSMLGVTPEFRVDHAQYVDHWLKKLKSDKNFIFNAAKDANKAIVWMQEESGLTFIENDEPLFEYEPKEA